MAKRGRKPNGAKEAAPKGARRRRRKGSSDGRLADVVARYTSDLVAAVTQEVRRSVADEVRAMLTGASAGGGRALRAGRPGRKRVVQCIAPGCNNPSKGPRFHYLCDKHKDAKKADYETWRKARKEKGAAAAA